jgi:hypothetical protein
MNKIKKIQLLATPRSGSNYLHNVMIDYMRSMWIRDPLVPHMFSEISFEKRQAHCRKTLNTMHGMNKVIWKAHPAVFMNPIMDGLDEYKDELIGIADYTIGLTRRKLFESCLSGTIGRKTKRWIQPYDYTNLTITKEEFLEYCDIMLFKHVKNFVNNPYNIKFDEVLFYEDLSCNPRLDFASLDFVNVSSEKLVRIDSRIQKSPNKASVVTNYDEIYEIAMEYSKTIDIAGVTIKDFEIVDMDLSKLLVHTIRS